MLLSTSGSIKLIRHSDFIAVCIFHTFRPQSTDMSGTKKQSFCCCTCFSSLLQKFSVRQSPFSRQSRHSARSIFRIIPVSVQENLIRNDVVFTQDAVVKKQKEPPFLIVETSFAVGIFVDRDKAPCEVGFEPTKRGFLVHCYTILAIRPLLWVPFLIQDAILFVAYWGSHPMTARPFTGCSFSEPMQ